MLTCHAAKQSGGLSQHGYAGFHTYIHTYDLEFLEFISRMTTLDYIVVVMSKFFYFLFLINLKQTRFYSLKIKINKS